MKKKSGFRKPLFFIGLGILALVFMGCETWLSGKNFFGTVADEVKYANAEEIPVYVRYAARTMGDTSPNGRVTEKVDIPFDVTAVDDTAYQFYMWAAFSTDDYPTSKQYNNLLMLNSIEEFNTEYADKLLPPSEVWFEDARSSSTQAKVINKRDDVFIVPICVKRATLVQSIPENNEQNAVKNTGITIVFSRSMDRSKLINENGTYNQEYITIQRRTGSGESVGYIDYSEFFDKATLSASGKTLTIRQRPETTGQSPDVSKMLPAGITVLVTISKDACDVLDVEMESDVKISFHTSNSTDTGAPVIEGIGIGYTTLSNAYGSTETDENSWKNIRVKDKANIWAIANDPTSPGGSGSGDGNVYELYYSIDSDVSSSYQLKGYASGEYNFDPSVASDPASLLSMGGLGFSVDVSSCSDGLHQLRIYGTDLYSNSGYPTYVSSAFFVKDTQAPSTDNASRIETECTEAPNGWYNATSLGQMTIKGTGIVDSPEGSTSENLRSPKVWWNFMTDGSATPSADGTGWTEVSTTAKSLKNELGITLSASTADPTTGVLPMYVSFKDDLGNVSVPATISALRYDNDKPVLGTLAWENSSGEEILPFSNQALLDTQILRIPFTESLSGVKKLTIWRTIDSESGTVASGNPLIDAGMKIYYRSADSTTKTVLASGTDYTVDFDSTTSKATVTFASDASNYAKKSGFFYIEKLTSTNHETTVFHVEVEDSAINKCATAATKAIVCDLAAPEVTEAKFLDTNDDEHAVKVEYYGQASGTERYYLSGDTATFNATSATKIPLRLAIKESGSGVKKIKFTGDIKISASTQVYVGAAKTLLSTDDIVTSATTTDNYILFKDGNNPKLKSVGTGNAYIYLTNLVAPNVNDTSSNNGNTLKVELTDFADNEKTDWDEYSCGTDEGLSKIRVDTLAPQLAATTKISLKDTGYTSTTRTAADKNPVDAVSGYTNSDYVDMEVYYPKDEGNGSGVKKMYIKSGATIDTATKIYAKKSSATTKTLLAAGTDYEIVAPDCVSFSKTFYYNGATSDEYTLIFEDIKLSSVTNATSSSVYVYVVDSVGWSSQDWSEYKDKYYSSIKYLSGQITATAPKIGSTLSYAWPYESGANGLVVDSTEKNVDNNTVYYFFENSKDNSSNASLPIKYSLGGNYSYAYRIYKYSGDDAFEKTAAEIVVAASSTETTASGTNGYTSLSDGTSYSYNSPGTANSVLSGTKKNWSVVFVDNAGNLSKVHSFCIVKDTEGPSYKMGTGDTAADYFPFVYEDKSGSAGEEYNIISRKDSDIKYTNIYRTWHDGSSWTAKAEISVDLSAHLELLTTTSGTGIEWYAFDDHAADVIPSGSYDSPTWAAWTRVPESKVLKMHAPTTRDSSPSDGGGQGMHLWLKDYCGNITRVKIMKPEHAANGGYDTITEYWERDGGCEQGDARHFANCEYDEMDGVLNYVNGIGYFNDNAYFTRGASDCHSFFPTGETPMNNGTGTSLAAGDYTTKPASGNYSRRIRILWSDTMNKTFTKAEVDSYGAGGAALSLPEGYTPWYYSVAEAQYSGIGWHTEKMRVEYPKITTPRYLYIAIEDGVGNFECFANKDPALKWVYDNTPPVVSLGTDSSVSASGPNAVLGPITDANKYGFVYKNPSHNNRVHIDGNNVYYRSNSYLRLSVSEANVSYKWKCDSNPSAAPTDSGWSSDWLNSSSYYEPEMTAEGDVYLHFKDIVGNVTSLRLGGADVVWKMDATNPAWKSGIPVETFDEESGYKIGYDSAQSTLTYVIGDGRDLVVKGSNFFVDGGTDSYVKSGFKGLNIELSDNAARWDEGITSDYTIPKANVTTSQKSLLIHAYDNVGNHIEFTVKYSKDAVGPSYSSLSLDGTINKYGDTLYYSTTNTNKATVSVTGISDDIGVYGYAITSSSTAPSAFADYTQITGSSISNVVLPESSGGPLYLHLCDRLGTPTTVQLTKDSATKWRSLDAKPAAPVGVTLKEGGVSLTAVTSTNAQFTVTDAGNSKARISYLTGTITSTNMLWIYPQTASTANYIAGFSESADGSSLVAAGSPFGKYSIADNSTINLYTVDYAGNVSQNPLEITMKEELNSISCDYEFVIPAGKSVNAYSGTNYFGSDVKVKLKDSVFFGTFDSWGIGTAVGEGASSTSLTGEVSIKDVPGITSATQLKIWVKDNAGRSVSDWLEYPHTAGNKIGTGLDSTKSTWLYDTTPPTKPTISYKEAVGTSYVDADYGVENYCYYESSSNKFTYRGGYIAKFTVTPSSPATDSDVVGYTTDSTGAGATLGDIDISSVSSNESGDITIYAVDRAGNVSQGTKVNYECKTSWDDFSFDLADSAVYATTGSINYFNSDIEVGINWNGIGAVIYWQIGTAHGNTAWGEGTAVGSKTSDDVTSAGSTRLKIPQFASAQTLYIWIVFTMDGGTRNYYTEKKLEVGSISKWCYDATSPTVGEPSFSGTINQHESAQFYTTSSAKLSATGLSDSGVGLYGYAINSSATAPTALDSYTQITGTSISDVALPTSSGGKLYLHVADKLGNAKTVQLIKDSVSNWHSIDTAPAAPTSVLIKEGSGDPASATTNAKVNGTDIEFVDGAFTGSNILSIYPQIEGSYIAGFMENTTGSTGANVFEKSGFTDNQTISFYTMDYAGNVSSTPFTVTMKKSAAIDAGYTISVPDGKIVNSFNDTNYFNSAVTVSLDSPTFFGTFDSWGVGTAVGVGAADAVNGSVDLSAISGIGSGKSLIVWVKDTAGRTVSAPLAYPASTDKLSSGSSTSVTWFYDTTAPATPTLTSTSVQGKVDGTSAATNVHVDGNTIYYRADATEISFTVATGTDGHGDAQYANGTSGERTSGSLAITVDGTESTASIYAWDAVGNICATPLALTFVPVAAPSVTVDTTLAEGAEATVSGNGTVFYKDGTKITVTPTVGNLNSNIEYSYYLRKNGTDESVANADAFVLGNYTDETTLEFVVKSNVGHNVSGAISYNEKNKWCKYAQPAATGTMTVEPAYIGGSSSPNGKQYTITLSPSVPIQSIDYTQANSSGTYTGLAITVNGNTFVSGMSAGTIWIRYQTATDTLSNVKVTTTYGDIITFSPSASVFTGGLGIDLSSIVAGNTEDFAGNTVTRSPSIVKYFSTFAASENAEPVTRFASPSSFAIGNKVEVPDNTAPKKSVTSTTFDGYADGGSRMETVVATENMESPVLSDHSWKPEESVDAEEIAMVGGKISEKSAGIVEARDFASDNSTAEESKKPVNPLWFIALAAIFGTILVILQKKKQN